MKYINWKKITPHAIAVAIFLVVALFYCKPALEGNVLQQHDITQWKGMAQNSFVYKETHGHFPLWTNGMFSGMPAYQIAMEAENPVSVGIIGNILSLGLPKPINFFFLASICFYLLTQILRLNPYVGIISALAYAYATYNPIIIAAGHDTKMMALAYLPAFIGAILLIFHRQYLAGAGLTALFTALFVGANHLQITYYACIIVGIMSISFAIIWIKQKDFKHLFAAGGITIATAILGIMVNAVTLFTTSEYAKKSIRGGSELADEKSNVTKTGLTTDYALSYSVYKTEPLVLMFPRIYGGSSNQLEVAEEKSKAIEALQQMPQNMGRQLQQYLQFYWGGIDGVGTSGPPYTGAVVCFLALVGFVIVDKKYKWWILATCILTLLMSWGKYFETFNLALLKYLPLYNKFRAPSMILVVPTFLLCLLAALSLNKILTTSNKADLWKQYRKGLIVVAALFVVAIGVYMSADFSGEADKMLTQQINTITDPQQFSAVSEPVKAFVSGLKEDRKSLFLGDVARTLLFCCIVGVLIALYLRDKVNAKLLTVSVGILALIDIFSIDSIYLKADNYQDKEDNETVFIPSSIDKEILKDTGYYRVFDLRDGVSRAFNGGALNAYFHKSIGGYHPAKLSIYQDLIEKQLYNFPNCMPVINMLNTKYIILPNNGTGSPGVQQNFDALGAAWFVKAVKFEKDAVSIMNGLTNFNPRDTALVNEKDKDKLTLSNTFDTAATIQLIKNDNDFIEYQSNSNTNQFAVFSEVFYDAGWVAKIDDKEMPIVATNYVLRGLSIPTGQHKITFEFKPASYYNTVKLSIATSAIIWLLLIGAIVLYIRNKEKTV
ncbi:MAG: YfhO family protein [Chitinophagaceae bacterium]|nr:YfhO family protein [Chitinophagaceae bacterium]MCW5905299.1 YfhO family protein [Chitinophagaceae bacterium]